METFKKILLIALAVVLAVVVASSAIVGTFLFHLNRRTAALAGDWQSLTQALPQAVQAGPEHTLTQQVSCGYAVLSLFGEFAGVPVTEEALAREHDTVVTATADGFCREMNRLFPDYTTRMESWLTDPELLAAIHDRLSQGIPVPIQWAAQKDGVWTLHYSLVTGLDLPGDRVTVLNPYGLVEQLPVQDFLDRTSFRAYKNMPFWMTMAFALDVFEKNTVFLPFPN